MGGYRIVYFVGATLFAAAGILGFGYAVATEGPTLGYSLDPMADARRFESEGRHRDSARAYRTLAQLEPTDLDAYRAWATALEAAGDSEGALRAYAAAVAARPRNATAHMRLGAAFLERGRGDDALGSLTTALRLRPTNADALTLVGDLMRQRGRPAQAIESYLRALAVVPSAVVHNKLGIALGDIGRIDAALEQFERAVELDPGLDEARVNRDRAKEFLANVATAPEQP